MTAFHEPDYISFLRHVTPDNQVRHRLVAGTVGFAVRIPQLPSAANSAQAIPMALTRHPHGRRAGMLRCQG